MEFPFGHQGHHDNHHRRDDDDEEQRYPRPGYQPYPDDRRPAYDAPHPPPPQYGGNVYGPPGYQPYPDDRRPAYDALHPPPPQYGGNVYGSPGYPPVQHVSHVVGPGYDEPPASYGGSGEHGYGRVEAHHHHHHHDHQPPFSAATVEHVSHQSWEEAGSNRHDHRPPFSAAPVEHVSHQSWEGAGSNRHDHRPPFSAAPVEHVSHQSWEGAGSNRQQTVRVFTKAKEDFALTIRDGKVVLAPANPRDEFQHWIKDMRYSTKVKDQEGFPSFALVNKVTGEAIKHSIGATHLVRLVPYKPDYLDESVLWTESNDTGEGFRCIRMVNNIGLNFDAFHGDEDHGGVHDGTAVVLWEWLKGKNQRWKIVPY